MLKNIVSIMCLSVNFYVQIYTSIYIYIYIHIYKIAIYIFILDLTASYTLSIYISYSVVLAISTLFLHTRNYIFSFKVVFSDFFFMQYNSKHHEDILHYSIIFSYYHLDMSSNNYIILWSWLRLHDCNVVLLCHSLFPLLTRYNITVFTKHHTIFTKPFPEPLTPFKNVLLLLTLHDK